MKVYADYKCIIVGDIAVGKSALLTRATKQSFTGLTVPTVTIDIEETVMNVRGKKIKLTIWDTSGQEQFKSITRSYFCNASIGFIVYDVTDMKTFEAVQRWFDDCLSYGRKDITLILVGNKTDLAHKRQVPTAYGVNLANNLEISFFEASACTGENVSAIFKEAAKQAIEIVPQVPEIKRASKKLKAQPVQRKKCC